MIFKKPEYDLKRSYPVFMEAGIIAALSFLLILTHIRLPQYQPEIKIQEIKEATPLVLPPVIKTQPTLVPPPPIPDLPVLVPDDTPIEIPPPDFTEFSSDLELEIPPLEEEVEIEITEELLAEFEVLPEMIGGEDAFRAYLDYPHFALRNGIEGIVEVEFYVNKKGEVVNPKIIKGIGGGCDEAVLRAIKKQRYSPGVKNGEIAEFKMKETVQFIIIDLH